MEYRIWQKCISRYSTFHIPHSVLRMKGVKSFQKTVLDHWRVSGRHTLPWRQTTDPYKILVSEIMLQQTQVDRVIPYYKKWIKKFPTPQKLARAQLSSVLKLWSGLGYNRRAKYLHDAAKTVVKKFPGEFPRTYNELRDLPGVGDYTARAVRAFAFNEFDVLIETNIRTALFQHFDVYLRSSGRTTGGISDKELYVLAEKVAAGQGPRIWHWALMDYGAHLKKNGVKLNSKSAHYTKQSKFEGSHRQLRGKLLRRLVLGPITRASVQKMDAKNAYQLSMALQAMVREGLVVKEKGKWRIA